MGTIAQQKTFYFELFSIPSCFIFTKFSFGAYSCSGFIILDGEDATGITGFVALKGFLYYYYVFILYFLYIKLFKLL